MIQKIYKAESIRNMWQNFSKNKFNIRFIKFIKYSYLYLINNILIYLKIFIIISFFECFNLIIYLSRLSLTFLLVKAPQILAHLSYKYVYVLAFVLFLLFARIIYFAKRGGISKVCHRAAFT